LEKLKKETGNNGKYVNLLSTC